MAIVQHLVKHPSGYELLRWGHPPALPVMQGHGVGKEATLVLSVKVHTGQQSSLGPDWQFNLLARVVIRLQETGSPVVSLSTHRLANVQSGFGKICPKDLQIEPNFLWSDQVWKGPLGSRETNWKRLVTSKWIWLAERVTARVAPLKITTCVNFITCFTPFKGDQK